MHVLQPDLPAAQIDSDPNAAIARITLSYLWRHRRLPHLDDPRRFTEWVQ
ncbi:hypothetical protein [Qipengyuania sp.]